MTLIAVPKDPRIYQIATLSALLAFGWSRGAFELLPAQLLVIVGSACAAQGLGSFMTASKLDLKSPLITSLSLALLLRADALWPLALAAMIAVGSKFMLRINGKHIFNPANLGIVAMVLFSSAAWTTPGQWGVAIWFAALLAGLGMFVTYRAARIDVPLVFIGVFAALIIGRALWLGDPLSIPLLRLQNGALVLFAFFMISDPKTTPDGLGPRVAFVSATALLAYVLTYHFFITDGLFIALTAMCIARPFFELFDKAVPYQWGDRAASPLFLRKPHFWNKLTSSTNPQPLGETK